MWRQRRELSYLMHEWDDVNLPYEHQDMSDDAIIKIVLKFFKEGSELLYPAKSYFVAVVYAKMLNKYFGVDVYEALDQPDLLPDDKYFTQYKYSRYIYDNILANIEDPIEQYPGTAKTLQYFKEEFLIGTNSESNKTV